MAKGTLYLTLPPRPANLEPDLDFALEGVGADVVARSHRLRGERVRFAMAWLDEGQEERRERWRAALEALDVAPDELVFSTEPRHERAAKALFLKLERQGDVYRAANGSEAAYFIALSRQQERVREHFLAHPAFIRPAAQHDSLSRRMSEAGLPDRRIARARPGPGTSVPSAQGFVLESWFDGLVAYLTGSGYLESPAVFEDCWPPEVQVVGPEALEVHALAWPATLAALGLSPPSRLLVRSALQEDAPGPSGEVGPARDPVALASRYGSDATRAALLTCADYTGGGRVSADQLFRVAYARLGEDLEALVGTVLTAIQVQSNGVVPGLGSPGAGEDQLLQHAQALAETVAGAVAAFDFRLALEHIGSVVRRGLDYARRAGVAGRGGQEPAARPHSRGLGTLAEVVRRVSLCLEPMLPRTARAMHTGLGLEFPGGTPGESLRGDTIPAGARIRWPVARLPVVHVRAEERG